jgi:serine/threonine protein kinase
MILKVNQAYDGYRLDEGIREHIVRFLDVDRVEIPSALIIEFINGITLDDQYRSVAPDVNRIDNYAKTILNVVKALHQKNILHRDISPHNLITTPNPNRDPVLIDFGTVKDGFNQIAAPHWSQIVKPGYSAPELSMGLASPSSDLYSTAATLLFMYSGVNPQYLRTSTGELDESKPQLQKIPRERLQIIKKAMSYHPGDRYQTADDMLSALAGNYKPVTLPNIIASGRRFLIQQPIIIGRQHQCETECRRRGFYSAPDVAIIDPERYIGRHHAMIRLGKNGECYLEDLHAVSGTAIRHAGGQRFERLQPGHEYRLQHGDIVALAYSSTKGPYTTFSYQAKS